MGRHAFVGISLLVVVLTIASCGSSTKSASNPTPSSPTTTTTAPPKCPNPEGGSRNTCLGTVAAGTYTTKTFTPQLTYTVPDRWQNFEDLTGNFLLVPPGSSLEGVNAATSDYIGVYTSIRAPAGCSGKQDPTIPGTIAAYVDWVTKVPGLTVSAPKPVTVGGLSGSVLDITVAPDFLQHACNDRGDRFIDVLVGTAPSSLVHSAVPNLNLNLYVLQYKSLILAIEVDDIAADHNVPDFPAAATSIVDSFAFKSA